MKEKIIQRKYKKRYTGWWAFSIYNFILTGLLIIKGLQLRYKFGEPQGMNWLILITSAMAIISLVGILSDKGDAKNYIEVELTGDVVKPKTPIESI